MNSPQFSASPSVDPREALHYHSLADTWWDTKGPFWPLHTLNALRIQWIETQLTNMGMSSDGDSAPFSGLKMLDIGCGGGILSESLAKRGAEVKGIDVVEKNIAIAQLHAEQSGLTIDYHNLSVEALADTGAQFDVVFNMEVVEHVADLDTFMHASNVLVRPGGVLFLATINRNPLAGLVAIFGAEYVLRWLPRGTHRYAMLRKPSEIIEFLHKSEMTLIAHTGVGVNPFTRRMYLKSDMSINYMLCGQKDDPPHFE